MVDNQNITINRSTIEYKPCSQASIRHLGNIFVNVKTLENLVIDIYKIHRSIDKIKFFSIVYAK